ncbi:FT-interacting protein 3-like [Castanea sativa]|uniref:FT-interacting protein 3-like n=1 Tax=Castanea sativa TaxID=21020 RepID=UPI003F64FD4F
MTKPKEDFSIKETSANISATKFTIGPATAYDLVEHMNYLFVNILQARNLIGLGGPNTCDPYIEVKLGNYKATTRFLQKKSNPEWYQVFAFKKEHIQTAEVEVIVKDRANITNEIIGKVSFLVSDAPLRVPPDSCLAPQWYRLEDKNKKKVTAEVMMSFWMGTQVDEAFSGAWQSDSTIINNDGVALTRSQQYYSPRLWYLRVNVIQAQDLVLRDKNMKDPEIFVKATLGSVVVRSKVSPKKNVNPTWNEDIMFVAAEPFDDSLVLSVENKLHPKKEESVSLGRYVMALSNVQKRMNNAPASSKWYNLDMPEELKIEQKQVKFASKLNMRISLDGGYHVLDECTQYSSDLRPTAKPLWRPVIGVLHLGILKATGLPEMKPMEKRTDAYCVAKYGSRWVQTRTIINSLAPQWNEQYTWDVYDPCTVISIGVFDNGHIQGVDTVRGPWHQRIGKVRIRLSTLEMNRVYVLSYPLVILQPSGLKKMGEVQLAVRFSCSSLINTINIYSQPLLPKMHYLSPLSVYQLDTLRQQAVYLISLNLSNSQPPLRKEVIGYILDVGSQTWSIRKSKANYDRVTTLLTGFLAMINWFKKIRNWTNPATTIFIYILFLLVVFFPQVILPAMFLFFFLTGLWRYRKRPRLPPHVDANLSHAYTTNEDELDEEFDPIPSRKTGEVLKWRYDRLRIIAARMQTVLGDLATQGERLQSLLSWRDPRATAIFVCFSLIVCLVTYKIPFHYMIVLTGTHVLMHPRLRVDFPSVPKNFLRRMSAKTDTMF